MSPFSKLLHSMGGQRLQKQITDYLLQANWFRRLVHTSRNTSVSSASSGLQRMAQIAREEITKDFGGAAKK